MIQLQIAIYAENTIRAGEQVLDYDPEKETDDVIVFAGTPAEVRTDLAKWAKSDRPFSRKVAGTLASELEFYN